MTRLAFDRPRCPQALPRAAAWRFMAELRRRARDPPVDSRDDHPTAASGLDRRTTSAENTTVSSQTIHSVSWHFARPRMIALTGLDDFLQTKSAITITGKCNLTS